MKLRPKKEVQQEATNQRANQINEGVLLARKIDVLRETLASLETQQDAFIKGQVAVLESATAGLTQEIKEKKAELAHLEELAKAYRKPLDDEWALLYAREKDLNDKEEVLLADRELVDSTAVKLNEAIEINDTRTLQIDSRERETAETHTNAKSLLEETNAINLKSRERYDSQQQIFVKKESELAQKEEQNNVDLDRNTKRALELDEREKSLNTREGEINDKYATLQRTIARLK